MVWAQGSTRNVFLTRHYAIKVPRFVEWRLFLHGLLANMQEAKWWKRLHHDKLCPVVFGMPGGWLLVMPRTVALSREEYFSFDYPMFVQIGTGVLPVEHKLDSFGWYQGRIVAVDYGS